MAQPAKNTTPPASSEMASFGKVAIKLGFVTQEQLEEAIRVQKAAAKAGLRKRLGDILIKKGYMTAEQLQKVLKGQTANRKRIGAYELISKLGEGGMGSVFRARQVYMDREIALKILSPKMAKNKDFLRRFVREARAVAKLNHPHIVAGIDVGSADGYCYFAMEFVEGETLGEYTHHCGGKLKEKVVLEYIHQIALALQHAHENSLLHRDVKPDNILLDKEHKVAKLADLGLVRSAESREDDAALTQAGQAVGTPFYISPEQARGLTDLTPATDLYSLGATMYHLLTGEVPYDGATAAVIMTRHLTDPVPSPRKVNPQLSPSVDRIVQRLMQKKPEDRYKSMADLADDIQRILSGHEVGDPIVSEADASSTPASAKKERVSEKVRTEKPPPAEKPEKPEKPQRVEKPRTPEKSDAIEKPQSTSLPEREATRQVSTTGSFAATRRRRRRNRELASLGLAFAIIIGCVGVLYYWNPFKEGGSLVPPPPPIPAVFQTHADGSRSFVVDFEKPLANFGVDPMLYSGEAPKGVTQEKGGQRILGFATVKGPYACMVRLALPADLQLSPNATLVFSLYVGSKTATASPDVEIHWENTLANGTRVIAKVAESDGKYTAGWAENVTRKFADLVVQPTGEPPSKPQYLDIFAGRPGQNAFAFIHKLEIHDPTPVTAAQPVQPREAAPAPQPDNKKETAKGGVRDSAPAQVPTPVTPPAHPPDKEKKEKPPANKSETSAIDNAL
jgi:serine/threonine-protein kinase